MGSTETPVVTRSRVVPWGLGPHAAGSKVGPADRKRVATEHLAALASWPRQMTSQDTGRICRCALRLSAGILEVDYKPKYVMPKQEARAFLSTTAGRRQPGAGEREQQGLELERSGRGLLRRLSMQRRLPPKLVT